MRLLWLLPDLGYTAAARQALLVAPELTRLGHQVTVAALRAGGPLAPQLRAAAIDVRDLSTVHDVPIRAVYELESLLRAERFDLVHAWRLPALRALGTLRLGRANRPKVLVSQAKRSGRWNPLDKLLGLRADTVAADLGEEPAGRSFVPFAVAPPGPALALPLLLPADARIIMCLGTLTPERGFRDAIWAFDVLRHVYPNLYLVIVGDGRERERLLRFAKSLGGETSRVRLIHDGTAGAALLPNAEVVWVPSRKPCGELVALEAQAAGVPVVASQLPGLAAAIVNQQAGFLVPPGNPIELAKVTRPLLDQADLHRRMAEAARQNMAAGHSPAEVAGRWLHVYEQTLGRAVAVSPPS